MRFLTGMLNSVFKLRYLENNVIKPEGMQCQIEKIRNHYLRL